MQTAGGEFTRPTSADALSKLLTTNYRSGSDFDVWLCTKRGESEATIAYALPAAGVLGAGLTGVEFTIAEGGQAVFQWEPIGSNGNEYTFIMSGDSYVSNNYTFTDEDSWDFDYYDLSPYSCARVPAQSVPLVIN